MTVIVKRHPSANVSFGNYSGHAGVDRGQTPWRVSFVGRKNVLGIETGTVGAVDEDAARVVDIVNSPLVKGTVVLTVEPIEA